MPILKKEAVASSGAQIISGVTKPIHSTRVRLQLPAIVTPRRPQSIAISEIAQQEFIGQLLHTQSVSQAKQKLRPIKILAPYQNKLTTLEAQRIIGVLDELRLKCEVILALPNVLKDLSTYEELLGKHLTDILKKHASLLEEYSRVERLYFEARNAKQKMVNSESSTTFVIEESEARKVDHGDISSATSRSRHTALTYLNKNLPATSSNQQKIKDNSITLPSRSRSRSASDSYSSYLSTLSIYTVAQQDMIVHRLNQTKSEVDSSIKNILRAFGNDEKIMRELLIETGGKRYKEGTYFLQCLAELRDMLFERLLVTPQEEQEKMQFLAQIAAQDKNNQLVIQKLEADLALANEDRDKELMKENDIIRQLQANLEMLEKATEDDIRRAKTESEKQRLADNRASQIRKEKLGSDVRNLSSELGVNTSENRDAEQLLRKKKYKLESEVENWIQKYDEEMSQKQEEYEKIEAKYNEEKKQLAELESRFKVLDEEYREIMKRRQEAQDAKDEQLRGLQKQVTAVVAIQALYRSFRVRQMLKAKDKRKGKGKKKKKKKAKK